MKLSDSYSDLNISFYNENATGYFNDTVDAQMSSLQDEFLSLIQKETKILDFGCGSGRDSKRFLNRGYEVTAVDGSEKLCELAESVTGIKVINSSFGEFSTDDTFGGIWACASLLHLKTDDLKRILQKLVVNLETNGILYVSFKYGNSEGIRNGRYFNDMTADKIGKITEDFLNLKLMKLWITGDTRPGRKDEKWLNAFYRKI